MYGFDVAYDDGMLPLFLYRGGDRALSFGFFCVCLRTAL